MAEFLAEYLGVPWLAYAVAGLVHVVLLLTLVLAAAASFTWAERKVSARIQDRLGPTRTGGRFGWLQSPADGLKLLCKEDLVPAAADRMLFKLAPYISFCAAFCAYLALPFADGFVALRMNVAVFFILSVASLEIFGVILGGYASASKWSLYGAMREAAQVVSYEIPLGLCVVIPVMIAGTMDLVAIGNQQAGMFYHWYLFHDPFTFLAYCLFMVCATAGTNRAPFDLPEAESELVAGFLTEYSGFRWSIFFMAEYGAMFALSGIGAILFLGGWNGPLPIAELLHLTHDAHPLAGYVGNLLGLCIMLAKCVAGVIFMMCLRWTLPRLRIDQVMTTCLKYCVPLAAAAFVGAMVRTYFVPDGVIFGFPETVAEQSAQAEQAVHIEQAAVATPDDASLLMTNVGGGP